MPTLGQVAAVLDGWYDPAWAQPWDAVGMACGQPEAPVRRILLAVDPVGATVDEARALGADLLITHHPLLLRPVHSVAATGYKGRLLHQLIGAGIGLYTAHTNADVACPGVSDSLAALFGLLDTRPLGPGEGPLLDKVVTFVPVGQVDAVVDALAAAGAGAIGDYSRCAWLAAGTGTFLPGEGAEPAIGRPGEVEQVSETRVEMVLPREHRVAVLRALLAAHPYEQPAYDVFELASLTGPRGFGRVGELAAPVTLRAFAERAAALLPAAPGGLRVAGDPARPIRTVAVAGGAGDDYLLDAGKAGADVYLTADLRHHPASEHVADGGPALIDAPHWSTEQPWLSDLAVRLRSAWGDTVDTLVSQLVTDPWSLHVPPTTEPLIPE
ncbi:MAG: Nif3-like dinuclear metal center hexameric protein [Actinomycetota bacterium]|nr:Nif3-like dinuclear metal center hexameric protein [Actinomycetota bacterium]